MHSTRRSSYSQCQCRSECVGKYPSRERWVDPVQSRRKVGSHGGCDPLLDLYAGPAGLVPRQTEGRPDGLRLGGLN
eukprot:s10_g6.t1